MLSLHGRGVTAAWNWRFVLTNALSFVIVEVLFLVGGVTVEGGAGWGRVGRRAGWANGWAGMGQLQRTFIQPERVKEMAD